MSSKKKGLGRGLSALFGDEKPVDKSKKVNQTNAVAISDLSRNPYQPRQHFSVEKLEELANSIKKNGVIQPIAVRPSKLEKKLGLKVNILNKKNNSGKITIEYKDLDQFELISDLLTKS